MKTAIAAVIVIIFSQAMGSQIYYMDIEDVIPRAGIVMIAEVISIEKTYGQSFNTAIYVISPIELLYGSTDPDSHIECSYSMALPRTGIDLNGNDFTESPLLEGYGIEFYLEPGDSIIALLDTEDLDSGIRPVLIRAEPMESLNMVRNLLKATGESTVETESEGCGSPWG